MSETGPLVRDLRRQIELTEADMRKLQARILEAEARAARAERSAREAWSFAKIMLRRPRQHV